MEKISWTDHVKNEVSVTKILGVEECPTYNKTKEG